MGTTGQNPHANRMGRNPFFRVCAIWLLLLAVSPVTLPCLTYDLSAPAHEGTPAADASATLKASSEEAFAAERAQLVVPIVVTPVRWRVSGPFTPGSIPRLISPVLRI